jgi:hypothetical protein
LYSAIYKCQRAFIHAFSKKYSLIDSCILSILVTGLNAEDKAVNIQKHSCSNEICSSEKRKPGEVSREGWKYLGKDSLLSAIDLSPPSILSRKVASWPYR